jgi:hypothetical protein
MIMTGSRNLTQRFNAGAVSARQKKNILGVISRYVIVLDLVGLT